MPFNIDDLGDEFLSEAASRISKRLKKIDRTLHLIANGRGYLAESKSRRKVFKHRQKMLLAEEINTAVFSDRETPGGRDELGLERNIGKTNDILSIEFLEAGLLAARSVGRITVLFGDSSGTAFHVGHQVVITNHHVLSDPGLTDSCEFELNVEENKIGDPKRVFGYSLAPDRFFLTSKEHDFTLVAVTDPVGDNPHLD